MDKGKNNKKNKKTNENKKENKNIKIDKNKKEVKNKKLDENKKKRKKKRNKGFSFVEILAAIVIIGILMSISIVAFSRYKDKAKNKDYEALAKSSYNAMEQYVMTHPYQNKASLETLVDNDLLSNRQDPGSPDNECTGSVEIEGTSGGNGDLDSGKYTVYLCCTTYKKKYTYPGGKVEDYTGTDRCSVADSTPTPTPGEQTYTITYVLNGGSVSGNPSSYSVSTLPITLKNPTRSGYTFDGWTGTGLSGKTKNVVITNGSTGNRTYTANWTASSTPPSTSTYVVTLNSNGATSGGTGSVKVKVGDTKLHSITNPRKVLKTTYVNKTGATVGGGDKSKNYTLNGWYTARTGGKKVASNATTPVLQKSISGYTDSKGKWSRKSNATLYAQWGTVSIKLPSISKSGSTCRWRSSDGKEIASGGTYKATSANSVTFTATCTTSASTYTITLNNNGATTAGTKTVKVKTGDTKLASITIPKKVVTISYVNNVGATVSGGDKSKAYTLNGWYTAAENGSKVASSATTPALQKSVSNYTDANGKWVREKNTTIYAQWAPVTATLPTITKAGSTCRWKASDGSLVASGGTWKFTSANSRTFTADCTSTLYTVTLNGNGATTAGTSSVKVSVGDTSLPTIIKPKKVVTITYVNDTGAAASGGDNSKSYSLDGWYTAASGGSKVADSSGSPALQANVSGYTNGSKKWTRTSAATLYAHWAPVTATLPTLKKIGYTCRWYTYNGERYTVESGGTWKFTSADSRIFTAECEPKSVNVTFNCNGGKITGTSSATATSKYTIGKTGNKFDKTCTPPSSDKKQDGWKLHSSDPDKRYETANGVRDDWIDTNSPSITIYAHYEQKKEPTCELKISNSPTQSNGWYRGSVKIDMTTTGTVTQKGLAKTKKSTNGSSTITISESGTTTVYGYVKNADGEGECSKTVKIDVDPPKCGTSTGASTSWTNGNRTVKQACTDSQSGCVNTTYQKTYSTTTVTDTVTISDKAGNTASCKYNVYVDKIPPSCGAVTGASTSWTRSSRTIKQGCSDSHSGCVHATYQKTYSSGTKTSSFTISDKAGNTKTCSAFNVYVDPDPPSCGDAVGGSTTWSNAASRSVGRKCSDSLSGCSSPQYTSVTDQVKTKSVKVTVKDNAGNTKECPAYTYNIYLDRTAPTCGDAVGGSTKWSKAASRSVGRKCTDGLSGCSSPQNVAVTDEVKTKSVKVTVKDNAGNTKECPAHTYNIYLDRTAPKLASYHSKKSNKSKNGTKFSTYWNFFYVKAKDSASGMRKLKVSSDYSKEFYFYYKTKSFSDKTWKGICNKKTDTTVNGQALLIAKIDSQTLSSDGSQNVMEIKTSPKCTGKEKYDVKIYVKACDKLENCAWRGIYTMNSKQTSEKNF